MQSAQLEVGGLVIGLTLADVSKHMIFFFFALLFCSYYSHSISQSISIPFKNEGKVIKETSLQT